MIRRDFWVKWSQMSCREHLKFPPECTIGCGVRWHPFPTSETVNTISSCSILLKCGKIWSLPNLSGGKISRVHPRRFLHQSLSLAPTLSGLGGRWRCLVQRGLLWVSSPLAQQVHLLFQNPFGETEEGFEGAREQAEQSPLSLVPWRGRDKVWLLQRGLRVLRSCWVKPACSEFRRTLVAPLPG